MSDAGAVECDVLIVGAGINGAGLFRDSCEQGLRCLIVDKGDFGSGTSAAPSRLIHGGLKYLETGEFRLVAESTYERNLLLRNASHLVKPLPTMIPIYSWTKGFGAAIRTFLGSTKAPRNRGALLVKIGLRLYDFYGARARMMPRHRMLSRSRALSEVPALTPKIVAAGTYFDAAVTAPERLVLELIQDGLDASPESEAMNWTALNSQKSGVVLLVGPEGRTTKVRPKVLVNAAGPWIDKVNGCLGITSQLIGGTKGSHILLEHPELVRQLNGRMIYFEGNDGRVLLVFPYLGKALVGSTDTSADDPETVLCDANEIAYFMRNLKELLPGLSFGVDQIVYSYSGIRPLPNSAGIAPGLISRDHSFPIEGPGVDRPFPVISMVGGKWTTFRAFGEDVANSVLATLDRQRRVFTTALPIGGGRDMPATDAARDIWIAKVAAISAASMDRVDTLLERYGTRASAIALHEGSSPVFLSTAAEISEAEIDWIIRHEQVYHLEDLLFRRTQLAVTGDLSEDVIEQICHVASSALDWTEHRTKSEVLSVRALLATRHSNLT